MRILRWFFGSGLRVALFVASVLFVLHAVGELRAQAGLPFGFFQHLELIALDEKLRETRPEPPERWQVALAAIDENAIRALGRLPWSREVHGRVVERLFDLGAAVVAFDMTFSDATGDPCASAEGLPRRGPDQDFADAIRGKRVVLGVSAYSAREAGALADLDPDALATALGRVQSATISELLVDRTEGLEVLAAPREAFDRGLFVRYFGLAAPIPVLAGATDYFGTINVVPDPDGVIRRVPLISALRGAGVAFPTLALAAVAAKEELSISVLVSPEGDPEAVLLGERRLELEIAGQRAIDWYGAFDADGMPLFSIGDLLSGKLERAQVEGRVVFVAPIALGTYDQRVTPLDKFAPGVHVHATLAQNLLDGRHLARPRWVFALELLVLVGIGVACGLVMSRRGPLGQSAFAVAIALVWIVFDRFVLFPRGYVLHAVLPLIQIALTLLALALWRFLVEEREKRRVRAAFRQYLSPAVMEQVLEHPEEYLRLGGRRYEATVLFSDIRGFTTFSEALSPEALGALLNRYMTPMTNLVFENGGTLDKYIGDAVMAFFGAPVEQADHAERACRTALAMIRELVQLNESFRRDGLPELAIGVGLSSGPMTIGNMGSEDHFSYTALGDRVNLGSRLEGQTKEYGVDILVSEPVYDAVRDRFACRELGALRVKGKKEPIRIFELIGEGSLDPARQGFVDQFHRALAQFRAGAIADAEESFKAALAIRGPRGDKCAQDYLAWCEELRGSPLPPNWDGVRVATSK